MNMMIAPYAPSMRLWGDLMRMGIEAQFIMTLRTAGMLGMLPHGKDENRLMVTEKADACRESLSAAFRSAARGARADQILAAALKPYGRRTRANAKRLARP